MMNDICAIFDLDGTLVDSEWLCSQGFIDLLPDLKLPREELMLRYRGMKMTAILADIEEQIGRKLPEDHIARYRQRVSELIESDLKPIQGVHELLASGRWPRCVASNGPMPKIKQALAVTGLAEHFGEEKLFSAYDIDCWKPEPDLFLHAAAQMGFEPEHCVVIEDSPTGVTAGIAAGVKVFQYLPSEEPVSHPDAIGFSKMSDLLTLLEQVARNFGVASQNG